MGAPLCLESLAVFEPMNNGNRVAVSQCNHSCVSAIMQISRPCDTKLQLIPPSH
jgi:hypothetical protein